MTDLLIIGGGAAGLMAAGAACARGLTTAVVEHNPKGPGQKLLITGKGRCNVTNDCDQETLMANIPGNGRFLYSALTRFTPQDAMAFFEGLGVPLKVERGNRVFPVSDRSFDISGALERELRRLHVRWVRDRAREITVQDGHVTGVQGEKQHYPASAVVLATGGVSYPATGSTGDGYAMAAALGHTIVPPRGSLVPLESSDPDCAAMQGLSLRNVEATVLNDRNKPVFREFEFRAFRLPLRPDPERSDQGHRGFRAAAAELPQEFHHVGGICLRLPASLPVVDADHHHQPVHRNRRDSGRLKPG